MRSKFWNWSDCFVMKEKFHSSHVSAGRLEHRRGHDHAGQLPRLTCDNPPLSFHNLALKIRPCRGYSACSTHFRSDCCGVEAGDPLSGCNAVIRSNMSIGRTDVPVRDRPYSFRPRFSARCRLTLSSRMIEPHTVPLHPHDSSELPFSAQFAEGVPLPWFWSSRVGSAPWCDELLPSKARILRHRTLLPVVGGVPRKLHEVGYFVRGTHVHFLSPPHPIAYYKSALAMP